MKNKTEIRKFNIYFELKIYLAVDMLEHPYWTELQINISHFCKQKFTFSTMWIK